MILHDLEIVHDLEIFGFLLPNLVRIWGRKGFGCIMANFESANQLQRPETFGFKAGVHSL